MYLTCFVFVTTTIVMVYFRSPHEFCLLCLFLSDVSADTKSQFTLCLIFVERRENFFLGGLVQPLRETSMNALRDNKPEFPVLIPVSLFSDGHVESET